MNPLFRHKYIPSLLGQCQKFCYDLASLSSERICLSSDQFRSLQTGSMDVLDKLPQYRITLRGNEKESPPKRCKFKGANCEKHKVDATGNADVGFGPDVGAIADATECGIAGAVQLHGRRQDDPCRRVFHKSCGHEWPSPCGSQLRREDIRNGEFAPR